MVYNDRQYTITINQMNALSSALEEMSCNSVPDWLAKAQEDALRSQISELQAEAQEYSLVKNGQIKCSSVSDLSSLPKTLIQARVAKGLTQKDLAKLLGLKEQQIQRYESSNYMGASLARLIEVSKCLEIKVTESWGGSNPSSEDIIYSWDNFDSIDWNLFPFKEMIKRKWLDISKEVSPKEVLQQYISSAMGPQFESALHRKKYHGGNKPNKYSLLAWQARVLEKARLEHRKGSTPEFEHNESWLRQLVTLSTEESAPARAKELLAQNGIILVIEEHLKGTYLDGAAMLLETGNPVIALTLRFDRLDNFWFVLMHELGHVYLHLFDSLNMDFFDEDNATDEDDIEKEADTFALNTLIPGDQWKTCLSRFSMSEKAVVVDARKLGIHPSIIAGRIRKERQNYTILNKFVCSGQVRSLFGGSCEY
jgi:HTH-type transcriptional regulator/antitoxin HigA